MAEAAIAATTEKRLNYFERYLSLWVGACMVVGVLLGKAAPLIISQEDLNWAIGQVRRAFAA
jgi:ACR3 family arsenite transporter